ncbi:PREDICTED: protein app1-like isoform X2 [Nicrophorus vespilloides]|uniref:Protein app1-like isoform X2 n=1 Tax=Nicrophorus vespilloides TaxID=110193 RepID=A0ABM1ME93_NICVS|nr:PREDICTED: protein app1-like isoform X2 [Nicrophorus vespilloides]
MASQMPKLVNKQFNTPIGLYSEKNVREILDRESQMLANGAVGINFNNPMVSKPANLHNSAVLRMLEEEESKQRGCKPLRQWPPPNANRPRQFKDIVVSGVKRVAWPPPKESEGEEYTEHQAVPTQGGAEYSYQTPGLQSQSPNNIHQAPVTNNYQARPGTPLNRSAPQSPVVVNNSAASPIPVNQQRPTNFSPSVVTKPWAPVLSPTSPQPGSNQQPREFQIPIQYSNSPQSPQIKPVQAPLATAPPKQFTNPQTPPVQQQTPVVPQQTVQQPIQPTKHFEPPPSTITLRPQVPISQAPAPVFSSQPATATLKGGKNLRGDLKWPPEDVKDKMQAERQAAIELAKGPACRPRRIAKDYSSFFAQHSLNCTYPGYKIPPGTQYYEHHPVM